MVSKMPFLADFMCVKWFEIILYEKIEEYIKFRWRVEYFPIALHHWPKQLEM